MITGLGDGFEEGCEEGEGLGIWEGDLEGLGVKGDWLGIWEGDVEGLDVEGD